MLDYDDLYFEERTGKDDFMGQIIQWVDVETILLWSGESARKKDWTFFRIK